MDDLTTTAYQTLLSYKYASKRTDYNSHKQSQALLSQLQILYSQYNSSEYLILNPTESLPIFQEIYNILNPEPPELNSIYNNEIILEKLTNPDIEISRYIEADLSFLVNEDCRFASTTTPLIEATSSYCTETIQLAYPNDYIITM